MILNNSFKEMMDWFLAIRAAKLKALRLKYHASDEEVRVFKNIDAMFKFCSFWIKLPGISRTLGTCAKCLLIKR